MKKIWLIIKREYSTRVRNKSFLLSTFLLPLVIVLFIAGSILISEKNSGKSKIAIHDETGIFKNNLTDKEDKTITFVFTNDTAASKLLENNFDAYINIKEVKTNVNNNISIEVKKQLNSRTEDYIKTQMNLALENKMLQDNFDISHSQLDSLRNNARSIKLKQTQGEGKDKQQIYSGLTYAIGFFCGILIYITMFIYGAAVMRGVMEEKTNRIAEVIVSSVKPFQLMLGKIMGIGAVGLTQFLLWIILIMGLATAAQFFIPSDIMQQVQQIQTSGGIQPDGSAQFSEAAQNIAQAKDALGSLNWPKIIACFIFYFLGGFLFYSSLFAAVGSVVSDDAQEAQSLMLPITMPIIFAFIIMAQAAQNPGTSLAFWGSIIPFTSPIVMMGIVPAPGAVSWWQLCISMLCLIIGFLFTTWIAAKIYRTGILLYGKKATWKEMIKWAFRKG
jgi:ABC-2 type transport system permease protein